MEVALEGVGRFFRPLLPAEEKHKGAQLLLKMRKQWGGRTLLQDGQKLSPEDWGASVGATEAATALERGLDRALSDLQAPRSASAGAQLCEFLESRFRQGELIQKLLKQMGVHLTDLRSLAGPPGRTGRVSLRKALLSAGLGASRARRPLRDPPAFPRLQVSARAPSSSQEATF